ncbi:MAG: hypothetical protein DI605_13955 [Sphingomonas sp.]|nr:MAG: hypothetical protein DI605_13955 [Sphingomonas sp.]
MSSAICGLPVADATRRAAERCRYAARIDIAPRRPAIFARDAGRKQSPAEAEANCRAMADVYGKLGYELVPLPLAPIADRMAFLLSHISQRPRGRPGKPKGRAHRCVRPVDRQVLAHLSG